MAEILIKSIRVKPRYEYSPDPHTTGKDTKYVSELKIDLFDAGRNKRIIKVPTGAGWLTEEWVEKTYKKSDD